MQKVRVLGLDISKLSATYWILESLPEDPKRFARKQREQKLSVSLEGKEKLSQLEFDFAVLEPTGTYSRIWRFWLAGEGKDYRLVGHKQLAHYRNGWGLQKTDKLDGLAMAMYGLERAHRPSAFLIDEDKTLSDLVLYLAHLNTQKNGFQNNLRQKLIYQVPEWHNRKFSRQWGGGVPGILQAIAGNPSPKWEEEIKRSCGPGLSGGITAGLARILSQIEAEEALCERWIDEELAKPKYKPYLKVAGELQFSKWLTASLIAAIFPFEQFLGENGKRRIIHTLTRENGVRVRKDESLRQFKIACGLGKVWHQSGDYQGWVAGGCRTTRQNLYNSIRSCYLRNKKATKQGEELKIEQWEDLSLIKNKFDDRGMMKVARRWLEDFYSGLVREFKA